MRSCDSSRASVEIGERGCLRRWVVERIQESLEIVHVHDVVVGEVVIDLES